MTTSHSQLYFNRNTFDISFDEMDTNVDLVLTYTSEFYNEVTTRVLRIDAIDSIREHYTEFRKAHPSVAETFDASDDSIRRMLRMCGMDVVSVLRLIDEEYTDFIPEYIHYVKRRMDRARPRSSYAHTVDRLVYIAMKMLVYTSTDLTKFRFIGFRPMRRNRPRMMDEANEMMSEITDNGNDRGEMRQILPSASQLE